jgi:SAM-dependent methyltransferase
MAGADPDQIMMTSSTLNRLLQRLRGATTYRLKHFRRRERFRDDYRLLARALLEQIQFDSVFDVGCANGFLLEAFLEAGREIGGIEAATAARKVLPDALRSHVSFGDFSESRGKWDLVCCVEVAEHIPPPRSEELVRTLVRLARETIYFTAAPPGQFGHGHINCRPHADWLQWFADAGWELDRGVTEALRAALEELRQARWLQPNSFALRRGARLGCTPQ